MIRIEHPICTHFPQGGTTFFSDDPMDNDRMLQTLLHKYALATIRVITIHIDFITKGFSQFSLSDIEARLDATTFEMYPLRTTFNVTGEYTRVLKILLSRVDMARNTIQGSNEACMTQFAGPFLMAANLLYPDLCVVPEQNVVGGWGHGPVDYMVMTRNAPETRHVGVMKVQKLDAFKQGFPQIVAQLEATVFQRLVNDSQPQGDAYSFGIVTDSRNWQFVEFHKNTDGGGVEVRQVTLETTINYRMSGWEDAVEKVFQQIVCLLCEMSRSVPNEQE